MFLTAVKRVWLGDILGYSGKRSGEALQKNLS